MLELPDQVRQPAPLALLRHRVAVELTGAGIGIPDGILDRIFEPFFAENTSTKRRDWSLPTVYGIVKQTGSFVYAESPPEGGAKFSVFLPVYDEKVEKALPQAVTSARPGLTDTGTVSLVEDKDPLADVRHSGVVRQGLPCSGGMDRPNRAFPAKRSRGGD